MLTHLKISLVLIPIAFLLVVGIYVYSLWSAERQRAAEVPVEAGDRLMRDLQSFHKKRGGFPKTLKELEGIIWQPKEGRHLSNDGRSLTHRNYYYLYSRIASHRSTLWAIPVGPHRDDGSTWFVVVAPGSSRAWKGGSIRPADIKGVTSNPSMKQLDVLGLVEQPSSRCSVDPNSEKLRETILR